MTRSMLTILTLPLAASVLTSCAKPSAPSLPASSPNQALVQSLSDQEVRDTAYCDLLRLRLYHRPEDAYEDTCSPVSSVVTAPQLGDSPLYIVFTKPEYEIEREPIRRGAAGPFTIFDGDGYMIPVFEGANMVHYESEVFAYSPARQLAIGHVFGRSKGSAFDMDHWFVQTLHVVPVAVSQRPALNVVLGPPTFGFDDDCKGNFWSWRYRDLDRDGWPEIQIGPRVDAKGEIKPVATFRWSGTEQKYIGPDGSVAEQFLQFQPGDRNAFAAYAEAWRSMTEKRTGYRLSWCRSGPSATVTIP
jgi:hypothetical protein